MANQSQGFSNQNLTLTRIITPEEWQVRLTTMSVYAAFIILGTILSSLPILLTFLSPELRKNKINLMVANLASTDFIFMLTFYGQLPYMLYQDTIDMFGCHFVATTGFAASMAEFVFVPYLAINRYIGLYHQHVYDKIYTGRNVALMSLLGWAFCFIIPIIFTMNGQTGFDFDNLHCCIVVENSHWIWTFYYWLTITVPLALGCNATTLFCNYKIYKKLQDHKANNLKNNVVSQNKEILYFLLVDMLQPIAFVTSYHLTKSLWTHRVGLTEKRVFMWLYMTNVCLRGVVTLTMLRPYRTALREGFQKIFSYASRNSVTPLVSLIKVQSQTG